VLLLGDGAVVPVMLVRLSFSGELGYEIYCRPQYLLRLSEAVEAAGASMGLKWYGARALMSMRLEKGWGVWTLDFRPDFTPGESGLDAFIDWDKDFVGKKAALKERADGAAKTLVTLVIDVDGIDVSNDEAILRDGEAVGYVSSGGYGHHVKRSIALGYVPTALATGGQQVQVVSYAKDREDAPSMEESCRVLGKNPSVLVLSCHVNFGASGAPIFVMQNGVPRIASVVSAKAEWNNQKVALGASLGLPLEELIAELNASAGSFQKVESVSSNLSGLTGSGQASTKFKKP